MQITIVGNVCIDKNTSENASYTAAGGPAVFMDTIYSQIPNIITTIVSPYGNDFLAVNFHLPLFPNAPTSEKTIVYENISFKGTREQKAYNREFTHPVTLSKDLEDILKASDILLFTPLTSDLPSEYIQTIESFVQRDCLKVLLPQGYFREFTNDNTVIQRSFIESSKILPLIDVVIVSEQDGKDMLSTASTWARTHGILVIVTLGEKGAVAIQKDTTIQLPTIPVAHDEIIDSVGAGDTFSAAFAYAYKMTGSIQKSGEYANKIARARLFFPADNIVLDKKILEI